MNNPKILLGITFILIGILFFLVYVDPISGNWVLLLISIGLFIFYTFNSSSKIHINIGVITSATLILMMWIFTFLKNINVMENEGLLSIFLSLAFWLIFFIDLSSRKHVDWTYRLWPIYPAIILLLIGLSSIISISLWSIIFFALGALLLIRKN